MEDLAWKISLTFASVFTALIASVLCYGLIYYEKSLNDRYRTLVNELYTLILYHIILSTAVGTLVVVWRIFAHSAPPFICYGCNFVVYFTLSSICFVLNEAVFVQYLYGCYYKAIGLLDEHFWFGFAKIMNLGVGGYVALFVVYGHMNPPSAVAYCLNCHRDLVYQPRVYDSKLPFVTYTIGKH